MTDIVERPTPRGDAMNPIQAAEKALESYDIPILKALVEHARTLEAELARLREPRGDGAEILSALVENPEDYYGKERMEAAAFITRQSAEIAELRAALEAAKGWLEGWASAEPQLAVINRALAAQDGGA